MLGGSRKGRKGRQTCGFCYPYPSSLPCTLSGVPCQPSPLTRPLAPPAPLPRTEQSNRDNVCLAFNENQCAGLCRAEERLEGIFNDCVKDPYSAGAHGHLVVPLLQGWVDFSCCILDDCMRDPYSSGAHCTCSSCRSALVVAGRGGRGAAGRRVFSTVQHVSSRRRPMPGVAALPRAGAPWTVCGRWSQGHFCCVGLPLTIICCLHAHTLCRQEGQAAVVGLQRLGHSHTAGQHGHTVQPGAARRSNAGSARRSSKGRRSRGRRHRRRHRCGGAGHGHGHSPGRRRRRCHGAGRWQGDSPGRRRWGPELIRMHCTVCSS